MNLVYKSQIINDVLLADSFKDRLFGYMFRKKPHYKAIIIKPCNSIHTFFMKFDIDVLFINEHMIVIKKIENLKRGRVIMPIRDARIVIEGKAGLFKGISLGDSILVK